MVFEAHVSRKNGAAIANNINTHRETAAQTPKKRVIVERRKRNCETYRECDAQNDSEIADRSAYGDNDGYYTLKYNQNR